LDRQNEEDGEINWAKLTFGNSEVMFQSGGKASTEHRREVDLYITTENVDEVYRRFKDRVQIVEDPQGYLALLACLSKNEVEFPNVGLTGPCVQGTHESLATLRSYFVTVAVSPAHWSTVPGALASLRT